MSNFAEQFQPMLDQKQRMFDNLRSPMVRRGAGGELVDESDPTGIDWLKANGSGQQSWEQSSGLQFDPNAVAQVQQQQQFPGQVIDSDRGRTVQGKYGSGFATNADTTPFPGQQGAQAPGMVGMPSTGPFLGQEKERIDSNIMNALQYNQSQPSTPAPKVAQVPMSPGTADDMAEPTNAQNLYATNQGTNDFKGPDAFSKKIASKELLRRQQYIADNNLPEDFFSNPAYDSSEYAEGQIAGAKKPLRGATSKDRMNESVIRYMTEGNPGGVAKAMRGINLGTRGLIDMVASPFRSGKDKETRSTRSFLSTQVK